MMIGDRELLAFRQGYYELLVSLLWKEPTDELLRHLSNGINERIHAARNLHPLLAEGWQQTARFLAETPSEQLSETIADEYTRLFLGPHGPVINPYESYYFTGYLLDRPLADIRTFLKAVGIEKKEGYGEPEDFLAFELEVMRWLTSKQMTSAQPEEEKRWLQLQGNFLREHLIVWAPTCAQDIEGAKGANFFRGVGMILRGFLEVERVLLREWGLDKVISLEEVRQRYRALPMWKGPTFEAAIEKAESPSPQKDK
jgi:TorA maturation chaperone TorD